MTTLTDTAVRAYISATSPVAGPVPNPCPKAIPGTEKMISDLIAYTKTGVLVLLVISVFIGGGSLAVGKWLGHHGSSKAGIYILIGAMAGAIVLAVGYGLLMALAGGNCK